MQTPILKPLIITTVIITFIVVVLGAYVRLNNAGLGCPDWPGCYGKLNVLNIEEDHANTVYPERPLDLGKAWKEMLHRYLASSLGLLILGIAIFTWRQHRKLTAMTIPLTLIGLVVLQGLLGMWTVTLLVHPAVVTLHLLGGMLVLALLWLLLLRQYPINWPCRAAYQKPLCILSIVALSTLVIQIALGGWTSTNYAALACYGFPTCHGEWLPNMNIAEGFTLWKELTPGQADFEGGVISREARVAIQMVHRIGALIASLAIIITVSGTLIAARGALKILALVTLTALTVQLLLGIGNVFMSLPLWMATAHNAGAAVLLLCTTSLSYALWPRSNRNTAAIVNYPG